MKERPYLTKKIKIDLRRWVSHL